MPTALDDLFQQFNKKFKDQIAIKGISQGKCERIPFSSPAANYMLYGGIPRARITEFFGDYSCGKTTTALDIISNAQKIFEAEGNGKKVIFVDVEHTCDSDWAKVLRVDTDELYIIDPLTQSAEQIFQMIIDSIQTGEVGLVVIDSLAAMVSAQAMEKDLTEKTYAGISAALTTFSSKVCGLLKKYDCTIIGINQLRMDLSNSFQIYSTPGGKAWKLACSVRLQFKADALLDEDGEEIKVAGEKNTPAGNKIQIAIKKTKICKPDRKLGYYSLNYTNGVDAYCDVFDMALSLGIIQGTGWYTIFDDQTEKAMTDENGKEIKLQGRRNFIGFLKKNDKVYDYLCEYLSSIILAP